MAGLQVLQKIDFLSVVQFYPNFLAQFTFVTTIVNIHNPSQLTLNIGDLGMAAGYKGYEDADRIGYTEIFNLRLVPGDNIVPSLLGQGFTAPNAGPFGTDLPMLSPTMTLWTNSTAASNPALNAGLSTLKTSVVLPQGLVVPTPPLAAYGPDWTVKILPTTVNDGIIEMSITVNNPFLYEFTVSGDSTLDENDYAFNPSYLTVNNKAGIPFTPFTFTNDLKYTVKAGGSLSLTFKMQLHHFGDQPTTTKFIDEFVIDAAAGPITTLGVFFAPVVTLTGYPITVFPDFSSSIFYPSTYVTLHTGPDFPMIKDWFYKGYNVTAVPAPAPPTVSTPSPTPLPSSTAVPPVTPSPPTVIPTTPSPSLPVTAPSPVVSPPAAPAA